jgi:hypothetical protein
MRQDVEFRKDQINAIRGFYDEVNRNTDHHYSLSEVVIAWLTEGHAELYRKEQLKKRTLAIS